MLLDSDPKLEEIIVEVLGQYPGSTVSELHSLIRKKYRAYSIPAIYQELRKLREQAVCTKEGTRYSVRLGWLLNLMQFTDRAYESYLKKGSAIEGLPIEGTRKRWRFSRLRSLGAFWTQSLLLAAEVSESHEYFEWVPYAWFSLTHTVEESQFLRALEIQSIHLYLILGSDVPLNRSYTKLLDGVPGEVSFAEGPFEDKRNLYISLVGDFVFTVNLGKRLNNQIEDLFERTDLGDSEAIRSATSLFEGDYNIRITIDHKPRRAKQLRKKFGDFFGV